MELSETYNRAKLSEGPAPLKIIHFANVNHIYDTKTGLTLCDCKVVNINHTMYTTEINQCYECDKNLRKELIDHTLHKKYIG